MPGGELSSEVKRTSVLRRIPPLASVVYDARPGLEGDVCAFALASDADPIVVEAISGRDMMLAPSEVFLGTAGHRESTRWVVGSIPGTGLIPGSTYWVLAACGIVGDLVGASSLEQHHLAEVTYLGAVLGPNGPALNVRDFALSQVRATDHGAGMYVVLGTSAEVGKTTAGLVLLRSLRSTGKSVIAFKATGTASVSELNAYRDFGAIEQLDCVDFGLPTTYPSARENMEAYFAKALDACLSFPADALLVECGGDMLGANVPAFLECLKLRRSRPKVVLAAADSLAALGGTRVLEDMGFRVDLLTGPCTDTPILQERTAALCGIPAVNVTRSTGTSFPL
jgi:hypothetical protein